MPITTPYRPRRRPLARRTHAGGVAVAIAVVALAALLTLPAAFSAAGHRADYRPYAERIQFKKDGRLSLHDHGLAAASPAAGRFRAVV